jgi:hypothetical protein
VAPASRAGAIDMSIRPKTAIAEPTAWEGDQEFSNALYMAYVAGELKLLSDYVKAGKPVPQDIPVSMADHFLCMSSSPSC